MDPTNLPRFCQFAVIFATILVTSICFAGAPSTLEFTVQGPFPEELHGPPVGVYVGELLQSGRKRFEVQASHDEIATVEHFSTLGREQKLTVSLAFQFQGESQLRKIDVNVELLNAAGNVIASDSSAVSDARLVKATNYLGVWTRPLSRNHESFSFDELDIATVASIRVTMRNVVQSGPVRPSSALK
ncbi:hypothetical protein [Rubinisphaera brasiliensis]|uniref:Uncharacterized protein n=1 Tax=Rubinisphaera brasiliensis (strain ATCC 49424 / DSM 5305 / JCM 21570 / IAM 15109 / NBRC 103401 / IFAM 1448) TaxID=756272 RepID=F0SH10_RUBBR|nr:hypothetical protein [Rubinisphaera brasiliensis]ADY59495.1 hypothetical protein Plabr_1886 [Rubinisphaera brasiliensis DSM 5305]